MPLLRSAQAAVFKYDSDSVMPMWCRASMVLVGSAGSGSGTRPVSLGGNWVVSIGGAVTGATHGDCVGISTHRKRQCHA